MSDLLEELLSNSTNEKLLRVYKKSILESSQAGLTQGISQSVQEKVYLEILQRMEQSSHARSSGAQCALKAHE